jgi:preprotein translocase subunit SecG
MTYVLLIIHLFVTLALIGVVLIQRSEGGGLGIGTSQGMGSFMSGRGTANLLTRTTSILGTIFFALSLALALLNRGTTGVGRSILDAPPGQSSAPSPAPVPAGPLPTVPGMSTPPAATPPSATTPTAATPSVAPPAAATAPVAPAAPAPAATQPAPTQSESPAAVAPAPEPAKPAEPAAPATPDAPKQ